MLANGDWVFVKRFDKSDTFAGMEVSEGAQVKNLLGRVTHVGESVKTPVRPGDVVHIPHYGVTDYTIFGVEYAVFKGSDLFAKEKNGLFHPLNGYVMVRKCQNDHVRDDSGDIALYMTENKVEETNWVMILEGADDCYPALREHPGWFFVCPEDNEKVKRLEYSKDYMVHQSLVKFITDGE